MVSFESFVQGLRLSALAVIVLACVGCGSVAPPSVTPTVLPAPAPAASTPPAPAPTAPRFSYIGRVTETLTGVPVTGATVTSGNISVQSGTAGAFSFDLSGPSARWCGRALVGAAAGHIWMNTARDICLARGSLDDGVLAHEIGHALGFWHLDFQNALMHSDFELDHRTITAGERYHASIAYKRFPGNRDIDVDANNVGPRSVTTEPVLIVD